MDTMTHAGDLLIVDDNLNNLRLLESMLSEHGYQVRAARDGNHALKIVATVPPELILLDIRMPGISGYEVCAQLKSNPVTAEIPVIFLSAIDELQDKIKAFHYGGVDYVTKPFQTEELLIRVKTHLSLCRLQQQLRKQTHIAEQANTVKSRFLAAASHDLRQPLHALTLFIDALQLELNIPADVDAKELSEAQRIVHKMRSSVDSMQNLFNGILDLSRINANAVRVEQHDMRLTDLVAQLDLEFAPQVAAKGLRWHCHCEDVGIHTDPLLLERILRNILNNAVKYTKQGSISLSSRILDNQIEILVSDTGAGIAKEQQEAIFDEFYQVDSVSGQPDGNAKGIGLGLAIVNGLVNLLGHSLTLDSERGQGTTMILTLDRVKEYQVLSRLNFKETENIPIDQSSIEKLEILIVEDDSLIEYATQSLLSHWGYSVSAVDSIDSILSMLASGYQPDLMIADFRLPGELNGLELIKQIRKQTNRDLPGILVSADTALECLEEAERNELLILYKPVKPAHLRSSIRACLRNNERLLRSNNA